jgi:hypothetical protein
MSEDGDRAFSIATCALGFITASSIFSISLISQKRTCGGKVGHIDSNNVVICKKKLEDLT